MDIYVFLEEKQKWDFWIHVADTINALLDISRLLFVERPLLNLSLFRISELKINFMII